MHSRKTITVCRSCDMSCQSCRQKTKTNWIGYRPQETILKSLFYSRLQMYAESVQERREMKERMARAMDGLSYKERELDGARRELQDLQRKQVRSPPVVGIFVIFSTKRYRSQSLLPPHIIRSRTGEYCSNTAFPFPFQQQNTLLAQSGTELAGLRARVETLTLDLTNARNDLFSVQSEFKNKVGASGRIAG